MAYLGKVYNFEKSENFEGFLAAIGLTSEKSAALSSENYKPAIKMEKNGDSYTMSTISPSGTRTMTFTSGVEFDDTSAEGSASKTTVTVNGDTFTEVKRYEGRGTVTFKREFSADKLLVTITTTTWDGVAKRYYSV